MGFDNECIVDIQSLAGEYFCPVCRLLVYPNEALQSQCTHLYCKPCLTYIVGTTRACPYDGYLVTEADSKPLVESNKALAETIGKIAVRCLYHRSGCQWQGPLSDCTSHCSGCAFGNSPVVCNRCAIQIVHRQVQEHAQSCPGVQPQATRVEGTQNVAAAAGATSASVEQPQTAAQSGASNSAAQTSQTGPTAPTGQDPNLQSTVNTQVHGVAPAAVPPPEQMYQQQYQQYYQQYPGYDPYHQAYQNYYPYQQQPQGYSQPQPQQQSTIQSQTLVQAQALPQAQVQAQTQAHVQPQSLQQVPAAVTAQASVNPQYQTHLAAQPPTQLLTQAHPPTHGYPHPQPQFHPQSYAGGQPHPQPRPIQPQSQQMQMSQYPQPQPQIQLHNPQIQPQPHSQIQTQAHPQAHPLHQNIPQHQAQLPHAHPQHQPMNQSVNPNAQSQTQQPLAHAVTGHHSYPQSQVHQHMQLGAQQRPNIHPQSGPIPQLPSQTHGPFPQQPPQMGVVPQSHPPAANLQLPVQLPPQGQVPSIPPAQQRPVNSYAQQSGHPTHQHPVMQPMQQLMPQPHMPHQQVFPGQASGPVQNQLHPRGQHMQLPPPPPLHPQLLPQGPSGLQPQQPQNYSARPVMPNHEAQLQPFGQSPARYTGQAQGRPPQLGANQQLSNQNHPLRTNNHVQISSEPQAGQSGMTLKPKGLERLGDHMLEKSVADKKNDSPFQKTAEKEPNGLAPALDTGIDSIEAKNIKLEMDVKLGRDEDVNRQVDIRDKDMVSELHVAASSSAQPATNGGMSSEVVAAEPKDEADVSQQGEKLKLDDSSKEQSGKFPKDATDVVGVDKGVQSVPMAAAHISDSSARSEKSLTGRDHVQPGLHERNFGQSHGQVLSLSSAHPTYPFPPADQGRSPRMPIHYPSSHQQRPAGPVMLQPALPPGPPHLTQVPGKLPNVSRPQGPGHLPQSGQPLHPPPDHFQPPVLSQHHGSPFGRTPSQFGPHDRNLETQPVDFQGHYGQGRFPPPHSGAPRMSTGEPTGSFNSLGGIMGRPPLYGAEGHAGQQYPINPVGNENFSDHRSRYLDGQSPGTKSQVRNLKEDSSLTVGLNDDRFKRFTEEGSNRFPMEPAWRSDRVSRPLDKEPFGLNSDVGLKLDPGAARVLPSYHPGTNDAGDRAPPGGPVGNIERGDFAHTRPDFLGPVPGFGRHHMDRFASRSPGRENSGFPSRDFGGLPGFPRNQLGLDDFEGHESRPFDGPRSFKFPPDSAGNSFPESRFPPLPGHFQRGELDGPGFLRNNDLIGDDVPSHLRRGEFHGPRNLPGHLGFGDPAGFGAFPGHARRGDLAGPENFPHHLPFGEQFGGNMSGHPNLGDRGFRSSYPSGGSLDPFDNSRKRKPPSNGWCRICKVDCESVEGLELHSQTREHQDMAMDMVRSIKLQNAKKQKISNDRSSLEEPSKSRGSGYEVRGNRR